MRALVEEIADHDGRLRVRGVTAAIAAELSFEGATMSLQALDAASFATRAQALWGAAGRPAGGPAELTLVTSQAVEVTPGMLRYLNRHPALSYAFAHRPGGAGLSPRPDEGLRERFEALAAAVDAGEDFVPFLSEEPGRAELAFSEGEIAFRAVRTEPTPERQVAVTVLFRALTAALAAAPYRKPLLWHGRELHERHALPTLRERELRAVLADLTALGFGLGPTLADLVVAPPPAVAVAELPGAWLSVRAAIELQSAFDPDLRRLEVRVDGEPAGDVLVDGRELPLYRITPTLHLAGVRHRSQPLVLEWHRAGRAAEIVVGDGRGAVRELPFAAINGRRAEALTTLDMRRP